jgi:DNA-binding CsgD family transcriptional regulator
MGRVGPRRGEAAPERWAHAAAHWTKLELAFPLAYVRWRQAEALLAHRPREAGRLAGAAALAEAHAIATRLGAQPLRREIESLARRTRLRSVLTPAPRSADHRSPAGLTPRECEILELLGTGATNRQIGQRLFISEKTVSIHVSRILAKLDAANRGEAVAAAHRLGIVRRPEHARAV